MTPKLSDHWPTATLGGKETVSKSKTKKSEKRASGSLKRMVRRAALTPREAKCCCACSHWHKANETKGECRNPKMRHGITYRNEMTGEETHVEWWTTGCYHSCLNWTDVSTPNIHSQIPLANTSFVTV